MFKANANKSKDNQDVVTSSQALQELNIMNMSMNDKVDKGLMDNDNNQNSAMIQVSGVVFDEISSPSSLSYHSHSSKKAKQGNYKSASSQIQIQESFENIHNPSQGAFSKDGNSSFVPSLLSNPNNPSLLSKKQNINDNLIHSVENDENIQFKQIWIPTKVISIQQSKDDHKMDDMMMETNIQNPWSSFSVNFECAQVILKICQILSNYNQDIEYKVNCDQYKVDGIIFMTDHNHVFFMISIYNNSNNMVNKFDSKSRIEFIRKSGDSLSFTRFCCDIKDIYLSSINRNETSFGVNDNVNNDSRKLQQNPLLTPLKFIDALPNEDLNDFESEEKIMEELDAFNNDLNEDNEFVADFMRIFCNSKLGKIIKEKDVLNHEKIINTLIQNSLNSMNICIVRGALIILISLIEKCQQIDIYKHLLNQQNGPKLMYSIINILNNKDYDQLNVEQVINGNKYVKFPMMTKKYAIRLLSKLTSFSNQINCFKNNQQFIKSFTNFESEWIEQNNDKYHGFNDNDCIDQNMLNQIKTTFLK